MQPCSSQSNTNQPRVVLFIGSLKLSFSQNFATINDAIIILAGVEQMTERSAEADPVGTKRRLEADHTKQKKEAFPVYAQLALLYPMQCRLLETNSRS
jgi:hypothetical protein